ncbi:MAG TPA: hypothetical protein VHK69_00105, partial [Chitinophagaceae bacterium]|nr:hypothetical protein [Chitinophagaceae bacterium]
QVKDIMPYPLAYWFEKILSTRNNIQALEENGALPTGEYGKLLRLQIQFYQSLGKLCGLIMLSNLYDFLLRTTDLTRVQLTRGQFDCLHSFFRITPEHRDSYDYTALIKTAREILEKNDAVPFIKEYRIFKEDFRHNEQLFEAHMEISSLKYRLDNGKIPDAELKSYCRKAEGLLWEVFEKVFFIFRYKLIIIRKIEIIKYRIDKPKFVHNRVILHKAAGDTLQEDDVTLPIDGVELDPGYTDSYSVMLFRGLSDFSSYLNLSPLAIDLNILKGEEKSALYLFSHIEANGGIVYEEVQNPKNSACILVNGDGSIDYVRNLKKLPKIEKAITGKLTVLYKQFEALRNLFSALEPLARQEPETLPS